MNKKTFIALLLLISSLPALVVAAEAELRIEDAWIAEAPPVSNVMVAYMTIINKGPQTVDIVSAESDVYSSIEFHETLYEDGMARMIRHESLDIPAGERLVLKRGGPHFMLFNPVKHLVAGDTVTIRLTTKSKETKTILVPVKKAQF